MFFRLKAALFHSFCAVKTAVNTVVFLFVFFEEKKSLTSRCFSVLYDIGSPKARAENQELTIKVNLNQRSVATRLWEIRISQIPFSSKAPSGCMQYFTGSEGKYLPPLYVDGFSV